MHTSELLADQDAKCSSAFFHLFKEDCIELCSTRALQNVSEETFSSTAGNSFLRLLVTKANKLIFKIMLVSCYGFLTLHGCVAGVTSILLAIRSLVDEKRHQ